jgi:hypothetical protein
MLIVSMIFMRNMSIASPSGPFILTSPEALPSRALFSSSSSPSLLASAIIWMGVQGPGFRVGISM